MLFKRPYYHVVVVFLFVILFSDQNVKVKLLTSSQLCISTFKNMHLVIFLYLKTFFLPTIKANPTGETQLNEQHQTPKVNFHIIQAKNYFYYM